MSETQKQSIAVLCDFDGTITIGGVMDLLYHKFADLACWELVAGWIRGELSTPQEMQGCFSSMKASRNEMEAVLDTVQIDSRFLDLVQFCKQKDYLLAIVSDGLYWYINYILERHGIQDLPIYANQIIFLPDGYQISTPWYNPETPRRGVSKPNIIMKYKKEGFKVAFVGDGLSDIEAVGVADFVYARDELIKYCQENGIPAINFTNMGEIIQKWNIPA